MTSCNLCGGKVEEEQGAFICDGCAQPRDEWLKEIVRYGKLLASTRAMNCELVTALEAVEWEGDPGYDYNRRVCPLCNGEKEDGHKADCPLAAALAKAKAVDDGEGAALLERDLAEETL